MKVGALQGEWLSHVLRVPTWGGGVWSRCGSPELGQEEALRRGGPQKRRVPCAGGSAQAGEGDLGRAETWAGPRKGVRVEQE